MGTNLFNRTVEVRLNVQLILKQKEVRQYGR